MNLQLKMHGGRGAAPDLADEMLQTLEEQAARMGHHLRGEDAEAALRSLQIYNAALTRRRERVREQKEAAQAALRAAQAEAEAREAAEAAERAEAQHVLDVTRMELPMSWENPFEGDERAAVHVESADEALIHSLNTLGRVDVEYMASVTGLSCREVVTQLGTAIFQNPAKWNEEFLQGWESADEYLSGNLAAKWRVAKAANEKYNGYFAANVKALEELLPPSVATDEIYVTLGSPWVPADVIDDFIQYLSGVGLPYGHEDEFRVKHDESLGLWEVPAKNRYRHTRQQRKSESTYGTARMGMLFILESTLNMRAISITDTLDTRIGKKRRVFNEAETVLALEKQAEMIKKFRKWVWKDDARKARLQEIYDARYGAIRRRRFDGSFLTFPGMSPTVRLYPYQRDAVARMILTPNTLLAHDVGAGKTFEMVAAGMEMRRMGISRKNLYVVPVNLVGQWKQVFLQMYPGANVYTVEAKDFIPAKRNRVLTNIRDKDYDAIIMAYGCFDLIPLSADYYEDFYEESRQRLESAKGFSGVDRKQKALQEALDKTKEALQKSTVIPFDTLGITTLFVDEAHNYKNVPIDTKVGHVLGISATGSEKCKGMMDKVLSVQKQNGGRGVVLATGTPITNSITDVYVMQKYLQGGELALLGITNFDAWVGMFAEKTAEFEVDVDTNSFRLATRFSRFHNLPELTAILSSVSDFYRVSTEQGLPRFDGYTDALVGKSRDFAAYLEDISLRADDVRAGRVNRSEDNMLKITTDGRKAALDLRLVEPRASFAYQCKVARCAENVSDIYQKTVAQDSAQLVFCDISTPKAGFNIYDELKRLLVADGIPEAQIAYVHDATTESKRAALFGRVRRGEVRILLGSTAKLGLGVNVQDKLVAIHHLDVPWRPADMVQRQGRILRQGNTNERVFIYRYITEGSFDAYSWQLLETKQRFISQLLAGSLTQRDGGDVDGTVLDYGEVKALAIGNPLIKKRVELGNELSRLLLLQKRTVEERQQIGQELLELPEKQRAQRDRIAKCQADMAFYADAGQAFDKEERLRLCEEIDTFLRGNEDYPTERDILEYQGFRVVAPARMDARRPFVWLCREGRYAVELGDKKNGIITRIDFFLDTMDRKLEGFEAVLEQLLAREDALREEAARDGGYGEQIDALIEEIARLDKKLGVKKV